MALYQEGPITLAEVAAKCGIGRSTVGNVLKRNAIARWEGMAKRPHPGARLPQALGHEVVARYQQGQSLKRIADELPLCSSTAARILREHDVEIRSRGTGNRCKRAPKAEVLVAAGLARRGLTPVEIAGRMGLGVGQVYNRLKAAGVRPYVQPRMTRERLALIHRLHAQGLDGAAIGRQLGRTGEAIRKVLERYPDPPSMMPTGPEIPNKPLVRVLSALIDFETKLGSNEAGERSEQGARGTVCARAGIPDRSLYAWEHGERKTVRAGLADQIMQGLDLLWWEVWREGDEGYEQARKAFGDG